MKYRVQKSIKEFVCLGAECRDTCCKGWQIGIDRESYLLYRGVKGAFGRRLFLGIDHKRRCFRLNGQACAFLNQEGLCDIYKELGRAGMCKECKGYPRHREDYGDLWEWTLSLSCPEAARIILQDAGQGTWQEGTLSGQRSQRASLPAGNVPNRAGQGEPPVDERVLADLEKLRGTMACLIRERSASWGQRLAQMLVLAHDFQRHWDEARKKGACGTGTERSQWAEKLSQRYLARDNAERFRQRMEGFGGQEREKALRMAAWMRLTGRLEPVLSGWGKKLERMCRRLYHTQDMDGQQRIRREFQAKAAGLGQAWENLALYFINTYVLGAVYDGDVYGKAKFVAFSVMMIREWCLFRYCLTGEVTMQTITEAAYRYSREVENSDRNLEMLEREFRTNPLFCLNGMLRVAAG